MAYLRRLHSACPSNDRKAHLAYSVCFALPIEKTK